MRRAAPWVDPRRKEGVPRSPKGEVTFLDALTLGGLAAAVVAGGGDDGGVAGGLLGGREVHVDVEQVGHDDVDTCQDHHPPYSSPPSRRSHSRALRLADSRLCAM